MSKLQTRIILFIILLAFSFGIYYMINGNNVDDSKDVADSDNSEGSIEGDENSTADEDVVKEDSVEEKEEESEEESEEDSEEESEEETVINIATVVDNNWSPYNTKGDLDVDGLNWKIYRPLALMLTFVESKYDLNTSYDQIRDLQVRYLSGEKIVYDEQIESFTIKVDGKTLAEQHRLYDASLTDEQRQSDIETYNKYLQLNAYSPIQYYISMILFTSVHIGTTYDEKQATINKLITSYNISVDEFHRELNKIYIVDNIPLYAYDEQA